MNLHHQQLDVCAACGHSTHVDRCGQPITEDIRVGRGSYDPVGFVWRTEIVDTCHCREVTDA